MLRLCLAMQLTLDSGMPIMSAMRMNLAATGNNAFSMNAADVALALKKGKTLTELALGVAAAGAVHRPGRHRRGSRQRAGDVCEDEAEYYREN